MRQEEENVGEEEGHGGGGESISAGVPPERGPLSRLEYDKEKRGIREAFIVYDGVNCIGENGDDNGGMVNKGKGYSASGVVVDDDNAETMISIEMEDLERAKVERGGGRGRGGRRGCSAWRILGGM